MKSLLSAFFILMSTWVSAQTVSTLAGTAGVIGNNNGQGTSASFNNPHGVAIDRSGNIYIANRFAHTIRKITPAGFVSTLAGSGNPGATDGQGAAASFNEPWAVTCDTLGNVYVADTKNYKIRKISSTGDVTTVAGTGTFGVTNGNAAIAQFGFPTGIAANGDGSVIYVCDRMTNTIRKIENNTVSTIAGSVFSPGSDDGPALTAKFDHPYSIALKINGDLIIADEFNNKIRMLSTTGIVSTLAGDGSTGSNDGSALNSSFNAPWAVCVDNNNDIIVGDANNFTVRKISQGSVTTIAGQAGIAGMLNGPALQASFNGVSAIAYDASTNSYILCDPYSQLVRKLAAQSINLTTSTGAGSFCTGSTITITGTPSNLNNYVFMAGPNIIGTSPNGVLNIDTLSIGSYAITCTATNAVGQPVGSNTLLISVTPGLQVSIVASGNTTICQGDTVTLSSSIAGNTYLWSNGVTSPINTVTTPGTYTLTVTDSQGCSGVSSPIDVLTLQPPAANVTVSAPLPVCTGDSVELVAGTAVSYMWSNGDTTQSTFVTGPGLFTVTVSNGAGCSAISLPLSVTYHTQTSATISPSANVVLVQGTSVTLSANTGTAYQWSTGSVAQNITVSTPGTYTVTVTDQNGCESLPATSQVSYVTSANMVTVTGTTSFCEGDSVLLTSVFDDYNQWLFDGNIIPGANTKNIYAKQSGFYQVEYSAPSSQPVVSDSIQVTVYTTPSTIVTTTDTVCKNNQAILTVQPQPGITYSWYTTASGGTPVATGLAYTTPSLQQTTTYYVEVMNSYGCIRASRFSVEASMYPQPNAAFIAAPPVTSVTGYEVSFLSDYKPGYTYFWNFDDPSSSNNTSSVFNPVHNYTQEGNYNVTLIVTSPEGCADTVSRTVAVVLPDNIFIPTGFTPNNDGSNDLFRVRGNNILHYDMRIFNQWGNIIFHSSNEKTGWNGESKGEQVPNGTYAYAIEVYFENGTKTFYRGNISVIR